jgi:1-acyl-sn-glycerol-3-phosphate acyltransferase
MDLRDLERAGFDARLTDALDARPTLRQRAAFALVLAHLGASSLTWNAVAPLLRWTLPCETGSRIGRGAISNIYRRFWGTAERFGLLTVDASALDVLRDEPGGLIVAANHPSMLDAMVIVGRLPRGVCVMKAELFRNPFLGAASRLARYIANDDGRRVLKEAVRTLRAGHQLVLFPEGTRTVRWPVNPFLPGIATIARMAQVPIQTVILETDSPYLTKGWPLLRPPPRPFHVRARLGERFAPEGDPAALLQRLELAFVRELASPP